MNSYGGRIRLHASGRYSVGAPGVRPDDAAGRLVGQPPVTFTVLGAFVVYATWAAFQGEHYEFGPYLSPFYSPLLFGEGSHSWFGPQPDGGQRRCRFLRRC